MKRFNLFLDDERNPQECVHYIDDQRYQILEWIVVRSHRSFVNILEEKWLIGEFPNLVSFDHDLDEEHYEYSMCSSVELYKVLYRHTTIPTGLQSALFLISFCERNKLHLPECLIHSKNKIGSQLILSALNSYKLLAD